MEEGQEKKEEEELELNPLTYLQRGEERVNEQHSQ